MASLSFEGWPVNKIITYSRSDLFDLVWSTPILKLAKEIGISDVALAKACRKMGIPLPGRGHWAKSETNRPKPPTMPKYAGGGSGNVTFTTLDPNLFRLLRKFDGSVPRIPVPASPVDADLLVTKTIKAAKNAKQDNGRIVFAKERALAVSISPQVLDRAMSLLDTLIKACRRHGYPWTISGEGKTVVQCGGNDIEVTLHKRLSRKELPCVKRERRYWERGSIGPFFYAQEYEWLSTNRLTFRLANQ